MNKNQKNITLNSIEYPNNFQFLNDSNEEIMNIEISKDSEKEGGIIDKNQESNNENEEEENNEKKEFIIELIIHTRVMDRIEELNNCICSNHIILDEEEKEEKNLYIEKEIIPSIKIPIIKQNNNQNKLNQFNNIESPVEFYIKLNDLSKSLFKLGFPVIGSIFNIFINSISNFIYFGTEPFDNNTFLYSNMLEPNTNIIKIKLINYLQKRMLDGYINNIEYYIEDKKSSSSLFNLPEKKINKRKIRIFYNKIDSIKRKRTIGYIIEKVYSWRKLYNGFKNENNKFIKYSLEKAAKIVGLSKKSLDDYLSQLRLGRKYGFNFDENKEENVGVLRDYINGKKKRKIKKKIKKKLISPK